MTAGSPGVAAAAGRAYVRSMLAARLLRLLTLVAVMLMPLGVASGARAAAVEPVAAAHHAAAATHGHCDTQEAPDREHAPGKVNCLLSCSTLPATDDPLAVPGAEPASSIYPAPKTTRRGLNPEADPPPPRFS